MTTVTYGSFGVATTQKQGLNFPITITPNNSLQDGIAPSGFIIASYLPIQRYDNDKFTHVVVSSGKPVALDSRGAVVPAGYALELEAYIAAGGNPAGDATATIKYTMVDVTAGVKNAKGVLVTEGEPVVKSMVTGTTVDISVGPIQGVAPNDFYIHAGGSNSNAATLNYTNFNIQPTISILMDYQMQYPVVATLELARSASLRGIACVVGQPNEFAPGSFLTYDKESNFIPAGTTADLYGYGTVKLQRIVGQISAVRIFKDPTGKVIASHNMLENVVAPNMATASVLNQIANVGNQGMGSYLTYSNGYGVINFGIQAR